MAFVSPPIQVLQLRSKPEKSFYTNLASFTTKSCRLPLSFTRRVVPMALHDEERSVSVEIVRTAEQAANAAGDIIRRVFRSGVASQSKEDLSPVTIADIQAEQAIRNIISKSFPNHLVLGEEAGGVTAQKLDAADYAWVIDPIDGTKAFLTGKPTFGILIAVLKKGVPVFGIIDQPILHERWKGGVGWQTTLNDVPVSCSPRGELSECLAQATTPDMFLGIDAIAFRKLKKKVRHVLYGSDCYAYALLASGHVDIVVEADLKLWDFMALVPVIESAGGVITDWTGKPLSSQSDGRVVAAASSKLHEAALRELCAGQELAAVVVDDPGQGSVESMTGFGTGTIQDSFWTITSEVKSLNSRYFDVDIQGPHSIAQHEIDLKAVVRKELQRGKVSVTIDISANDSDKIEIESNDTNMEVNTFAVKRARMLLDQVISAAGIEEKPSLNDILRFSGVLVKSRDKAKLEVPMQLIRKAVESALQNTRVARRREGVLIQLDTCKRIETIEKILDDIEKRAPERALRETQRLEDQIDKVLSTEVDKSRLEMEITLYADRVDITEEVVRLRAHLEMFKLAFNGADDPVGRRLLFLQHEMVREASTIAAKAKDVPISHLIILIKEELEKIREQCENIR